MNSITGDQTNFERWRLVDPPKHFEGGEDPMKWIREAKLFSTISNIPLVNIIDARVKDTAAEKWFSKTEESMPAEERFLKLFKEEKNIFQMMDEIRDIKQGKNEPFEIFYERTEKLAQRFMDLKPSEAEIHKNILLRGATDPSILERFAFEPEMPRKRILEVGKKLEDAVRLRKLQVNVINSELIQQMEIERENVQMQINALKKTFADVLQSKNTMTSQRMPYMNKETRAPQPRVKTCYNCNSQGHLKSECPQIECYQCHEKGHFARDCPRGRERYQEKPRERQSQCHECGNPGHVARDCALRRRKWLNGGRINAIENIEDTISSIHEKNVHGPTDNWNLVGPGGRH